MLMKIWRPWNHGIERPLAGHRIIRFSQIAGRSCKIEEEDRYPPQVQCLAEQYKITLKTKMRTQNVTVQMDMKVNGMRSWT